MNGLQILRREILEAIDDCATPEGCRRNFRFIKKPSDWSEKQSRERQMTWKQLAAMKLKIQEIDANEVKLMPFQATIA